jgi:hypothetical protein
MTLTIWIWVSFFVSLLANGFVFMHHISSGIINLSVQSMLIINLALSDSLMNVYLGMLSIHDILYTGTFPHIYQTWNKSTNCKVMAILSTLSMEMSLYTVVLLSITRCLHIVYRYKIGPCSILIILVSFWMITIHLTLLPVLDITYFNRGNIINSAECLLFSFTSGQHQAWIYGFLFYIILPLISLIIIAAAYISILNFSRRITSGIRALGNSNVHTKLPLKFIMVINLCHLLPWLLIFLLSFLNLVYVDLSTKISR